MFTVKLVAIATPLVGATYCRALKNCKLINYILLAEISNSPLNLICLASRILDLSSIGVFSHCFANYQEQLCCDFSSQQPPGGDIAPVNITCLPDQSAVCVLFKHGDILLWNTLTKEVSSLLDALFGDNSTKKSQCNIWYQFKISCP